MFSQEDCTYLIKDVTFDGEEVSLSDRTKFRYFFSRSTCTGEKELHFKVVFSKAYTVAISGDTLKADDYIYENDSLVLKVSNFFKTVDSIYINDIRISLSSSKQSIFSSDEMYVVFEGTYLKIHNISENLTISVSSSLNYLNIAIVVISALLVILAIVIIVKKLRKN